MRSRHPTKRRVARVVQWVAVGCVVYGIACFATSRSMALLGVWPGLIWLLLAGWLVWKPRQAALWVGGLMLVSVAFQAWLFRQALMDPLPGMSIPENPWLYFLRTVTHLLVGGPCAVSLRWLMPPATDAPPPVARH